MKAKSKDEPVGIVIRGGDQPAQTTVFVAYEYGPPANESEPKAA